MRYRHQRYPKILRHPENPFAKQSYVPIARPRPSAKAIKLTPDSSAADGALLHHFQARRG